MVQGSGCPGARRSLVHNKERNTVNYLSVHVSNDSSADVWGSARSELCVGALASTRPVLILPAWWPVQSMLTCMSWLKSALGSRAMGLGSPLRAKQEHFEVQARTRYWLVVVGSGATGAPSPMIPKSVSPFTPFAAISQCSEVWANSVEATAMQKPVRMPGRETNSVSPTKAHTST